MYLFFKNFFDNGKNRNSLFSIVGILNLNDYNDAHGTNYKLQKKTTEFLKYP